MSRKPKPKLTNRIVIRPGARIGFADAEDDQEFLENCYIDVGQVQRLLNTEDPGSILLGRTGSGKTACILKLLSESEHVIGIEPSALSLNYISNSNILSFFDGIGVDLDLFFQLLWRHVIVVELLNYHYNIRNRSDLEKALERINSLISEDEAKKLSLTYLENWGSKFWVETQERIREILSVFEGQLSAGINLSAFGVPINATGSSKIGGIIYLTYRIDHGTEQA